ncbi:MAG: amidohydrolase family protein [Candidatus Acidiferrales bacterium]
MKKLFALLLLLSATSAVFAQTSAVTVFKGAQLIDGTGASPIKKSVLVIEGGRITAAGKEGKVHYPKGARVIELEGRTIMPGIINAHGHLGLVAGTQNRADAYTRENVGNALLQYEQYGVTSMLSLGLNRDGVYELRDEQRSGAFPGATIVTAGRGFGVQSGAPSLALAPDQVYRPGSPDEARAQVREMAAHHPDLVKLWLDDMYGKYPKMDPAIYKAVIDESHKQGLRVAAHIFYLADAKSLINDGVDVLAHSIRDLPVDAELIAAMKSHSVIYVPTLMVDESAFVFAEDPAVMHDQFFKLAVGPDLQQQLESRQYREKVESDPNLAHVKAAFAMAQKNLKTLEDAGVRIAFGTDSGAAPTRIPGWAEHHELELMVRAGLTPIQAIVAATKGSAAVLGTSDIGTLEAGKRADFLVLAASPLASISNTRQMLSIWHRGIEIKPRAGAPSLLSQ